jgi:hypothetical protein
MKLTRAKRGDEVKVVFEDHVEDGDEPMVCVVRGALVRKGPKYITVEAWTVLGDREVNESNRKTFTILCSTILGYGVASYEWTGARGL